MINQFYIDYIKAIENPDRVGWNGKVWMAPQHKGYDKNQRGYGIDIIKNDSAKRLTQNRPGQWLTEGEANKLMKEHLLYVYNAAQKHIEGFDNLSDKRKAALLGMLYRGDSVNKNKHIININEPDDNKFFESISNYYKSKGLNERAKNSSNFFSNNQLTNFLIPMKWRQWEPPIKFKSGGQIRKMLTAAGGPIKRLKDGYRYIPDEQNGGWNRISDNSMSDVFATMEFTPKKTKVGSSITRKQSAPYKTYYSAYNPDDIIKGFNALTLGGLNNLSPTQWARRYYDLNKLLVSLIPGSKRTMTWSGFVNNWLNGNNGLVSEKFTEEHPYWSIGINGVGDAVALGGMANASKVNLVGNIAIKHGGNATKMALDVAKNSSKPFNLRNYKFLGDSRFYSDLDDVGYKTLMSERESGNYPLTFTERRNYITGLKNDIQKGVDYAINEAKENVTTPLKNEFVESPLGFKFNLRKPEDIYPEKLNFGTLRATKQYGQTPWEGKYGAFQNENKGLFFPFRDSPNTLRTHSMFLNLGDRISIGAHETRHTVQKYFNVPLVERRYDLPGTYGRYTNRKLPLDFKKKVNEYINDALTAGEWEGSLAEMDAELTGWSAKHGFPRYSQMNPKQKALLHDLFHRRFGGNTDYNESILHLLDDSKTLNPYAILREVKKLDNSKIGQIILGLEILGYRKQGGKMNIIEFLKNGSGIHIKEKNKGKFTSYCGGKVTDECIRKAKASGNPTLIKRATFAANARKWKHKEGGIIKAQEGTNLFEANKEVIPLSLLKKFIKQVYQDELNKNKLISAITGTVVNTSPEVVKHEAFKLASLEAAELNEQARRNKKISEAQKLAQQSADISGLIGDGLGIIADYFINKKSNKTSTGTSTSGTSSSGTSNYKVDSFWTTPSLSGGNQFKVDYTNSFFK